MLRRFRLAVRRSRCKLGKSCTLARGRNIRSDMWHYFGAQSTQEEGNCTHRSHLSQKNTNLHLKRDVTNAQTALRSPSRSAAPPRSSYCRKASSWFESLLPSSRLLLNACGPFQRLRGGMGPGKAALTARQSMVEVDVAQVLRRPFGQTHFVVVVDYPPTEETRPFISQSVGRQQT